MSMWVGKWEELDRLGRYVYVKGLLVLTEIEAAAPHLSSLIQAVKDGREREYEDPTDQTAFQNQELELELKDLEEGMRKRGILPSYKEEEKAIEQMIGLTEKDMVASVNFYLKKLQRRATG